MKLFKNLNKISRVKLSESGRSMVEMLGVLAVIGVLSITGIAGYKYAMNKYRINEIVKELNILRTKMALVMEQPHKTDYTMSVDTGYEEFFHPIYVLPQIPGSWLIYGCTESPYETNCSVDERAYTISLSMIPPELCNELSTLSSYFPQLEEIQASCGEYSSLTLLFKTDYEPEQKKTDPVAPEEDLSDDAPLPSDPEDLECPEDSDELYCQCYKTGDCEEEGTYCYVWVSKDNNSDCVNKVEQGQCLPNTYNEVSGTPYVVSTVGMTWWSANQFCESLGKNMVSKSEITPEIKQIFKNQGLNVWFKSRKSSCSAYYYAGMTPTDQTGEIVGEPMDINTFGHGPLIGSSMALCK